MAPRPGFQIVDEIEEIKQPEPPPPRQETAHMAAVHTLLLLLGTFSKRVLIAIADLFTLATVGSAFWLWLSIPSPNTLQLIQLGMYALFVLAANVIVRRK